MSTGVNYRSTYVACIHVSSSGLSNGSICFEAFYVREPQPPFPDSCTLNSVSFMIVKGRSIEMAVWTENETSSLTACVVLYEISIAPQMKDKGKAVHS